MRGSASGRLGREQQQATGGAVRRNQMSQGDAGDNIGVQKREKDAERKKEQQPGKETKTDSM